MLFEERYTTPMTRKSWLDGGMEYPARWYWKDGKLTAEGCGDRQFIYLHFMNWKPSSVHRIHGAKAAPWNGLERLVTFNWRRAAREGFMISHEGFGPLPRSTGPLRREAPDPAA